MRYKMRRVTRQLGRDTVISWSTCINRHASYLRLRSGDCTYSPAVYAANRVICARTLRNRPLLSSVLFFTPPSLVSKSEIEKKQKWRPRGEGDNGMYVRRNFNRIRFNRSPCVYRNNSWNGIPLSSLFSLFLFLLWLEESIFCAFSRNVWKRTSVRVETSNTRNDISNDVYGRLRSSRF